MGGSDVDNLFISSLRNEFVLTSNMMSMRFVTFSRFPIPSRVLFSVVVGGGNSNLFKQIRVAAL